MKKLFVTVIVLWIAYNAIAHYCAVKHMLGLPTQACSIEPSTACNYRGD